MKRIRRPRRLPSHISVLLHSTTGVPTAIRVNLRKVGLWAAATSLVFLATLLGTVGFFREVELNRRLSDHVLELELTRRLWREATLAAEARLPRFDATTPPAVVIAKPLVLANPATPEVPAVKDSARAVAALEADGQKNEEQENSLRAGAARARLADLNIDCANEKCGVHFGLVPTAPGTARGTLVVVLETEVPRIGTANVGGAVRKRFFVYPGNISRDEITTEEVGSVEGKPFKFSHALQTNVEFTLSNLLRPLAVNVYLFDASKNLIHHERKAVDTQE